MSELRQVHSPGSPPPDPRHLVPCDNPTVSSKRDAALHRHRLFRLSSPREMDAANVRTEILLRRWAGNLELGHLKPLLTSPNPEVREMALRALARIGPP